MRPIEPPNTIRSNSSLSLALQTDSNKLLNAPQPPPRESKSPSPLPEMRARAGPQVSSKPNNLKSTSVASLSKLATNSEYNLTKALSQNSLVEQQFVGRPSSRIASIINNYYEANSPRSSTIDPLPRSNSTNVLKPSVSQKNLKDTQQPSIVVETPMKRQSQDGLTRAATVTGSPMANNKSEYRRQLTPEMFSQEVRMVPMFSSASQRLPHGVKEAKDPASIKSDSLSLIISEMTSRLATLSQGDLPTLKTPEDVMPTSFSMDTIKTTAANSYSDDGQDTSNQSIQLPQRPSFEVKSVRKDSNNPALVKAAKKIESQKNVPEKDYYFASISRRVKKMKSYDSTLSPSPVRTVAVTRPKWYEAVGNVDQQKEFLATLSKQERNRQDVSYEILTTEDDYIHDLRMVIDTYVRPINERKIKISIELNETFSNLEQIAPVNEAFLQELKKCKRGHIMQDVGSAFTQVADFFKLYTIFCGNHSNAVSSLQKLNKSDPMFRQFIKEVYSRPDYNGLNLESYLLKPVQRICKYPLFLRELVKYTDDSHPDHKSLVSAQAKIDGIVAVVNERSKHIEQMMKTIEAVRKIKGANSLVHPTRKIVLDAPFNVRSTNADIDSIRKCQLFLFNDQLVVTKQASIITRDKCIMLDAVDVTNLVYIDVQDELSFAVIDNISVDTFLLQASTANDKQRWLSEMATLGIAEDKSTSSDQIMAKFNNRSPSPGSSDKSKFKRTKTSMSVQKSVNFENEFDEFDSPKAGELLSNDFKLIDLPVVQPVDTIEFQIHSGTADSDEE